MSRKLAIAVFVAVYLALLPGAALGAPPSQGSAGAAGIGDPYFPRDGNGGYDVSHYDLEYVRPGHRQARRRRDDHRARRPRTCRSSTSTSWASRCGRSRSTARRPTTKRKGQELTVKPGRAARTARPSPSSPGTTASRRRSRNSGCPGSSTPTTARSSSASRMSPRPGSRPTTIRGTRRPSRSRSPSRPASRRSPTASSSSNDQRAAGRPGRGTPWSRWRLPRVHGDRPVRHPRLRAGRDQVLGRASTRRSWPTGAAVTPEAGDAFLYSQVGRAGLQAADPRRSTSRRAARRCPSR